MQPALSLLFEATQGIVAAYTQLACIAEVESLILV